MSSRSSWRSAAVILILALAVVFTLDLDFPEWLDGLLFWRPPGQWEIKPLYGLDTEGGLQVQLIPSAGHQADTPALQTAGQVIRARLDELEPASPLTHLVDESRLMVELPGVRYRTWLTDTVQSIGLVEFFDPGLHVPSIGTIIETDLGPTGQPKPEDELSAGTAVTPTESADVTAVVYHTVLSSADLEGLRLGMMEGGIYSIAFSTANGDPDFAAYTEAHGGELLCAAIDKLALSCYELPGQAIIAWPVGLSEERAAVYRALLPSGALAVPLTISETAALGPALGENTVRLVVTAALIGLAALALFLIAHYRLAGLVAVAVLLFFGLTAFALCKLVPVLLTLPSLAGLLAAGAVALGGVCAVLERLREEKRERGLISVRSVGATFSAAWPAVRSVHLGLLALAAAVWYGGLAAQAAPIRELGVALLFGLLASLFATRFAAVEIARLALGSAREPFSRSPWLLGV